MDLRARGIRLRPAMGDEPKSKLEVGVSDQRSEAHPGAEDDAPGYRVALPVFEGPLDLLLHLIQQHEIDIFDIPIAFITQKYVEYVTLMQDINIDVASEYLVMAATLTHIKSKMLLPASPDDEEEEDDLDLDPRAELVRRLLEYQKYKEAAEQLGDRSILGRDVFTRGAPAPSVDGPAPLAPVGLFKLLDAFQAVLKRAKQTADHQIDVDRFSISDRINELSDILRDRRRVGFEELFSKDQTRGDLIVTFLALLEMTRVRLIRLMQAGPLEPISIELAVDDDSISEAEAEAPVALDEPGGQKVDASAAEGPSQSVAPAAPEPELEPTPSPLEEEEKTPEPDSGDAVSAEPTLSEGEASGEPLQAAESPAAPPDGVPASASPGDAADGDFLERPRGTEGPTETD